MRVLLQRVQEAKVTVGDAVRGQIGKGMLLFLGIHKNDTPEHVSWMVKKVATLRIFADENGKMNLDLAAIGGDALVVSQFTLYGDVQTGRRPEFTQAALPEIAYLLYEEFVKGAPSPIQKFPAGTRCIALSI